MPSMSCNDPIVMSQLNELPSRDRDAIALSVENLRGSPYRAPNSCTGTLSSSSISPLFLPLHFPGHCFGPIPAPGTFASSAFPVPP